MKILSEEILGPDLCGPWAMLGYLSARSQNHTRPEAVIVSTERFPRTRAAIAAHIADHCAVILTTTVATKHALSWCGYRQGTP